MQRPKNVTTGTGEKNWDIAIQGTTRQSLKKNKEDTLHNDTELHVT